MNGTTDYGPRTTDRKKRFLVRGPQSVVLFLAWRYLFSTRQRFVPLLAGVTLLGCTLGVFLLTLVLSLMQGFKAELQDRWIGLNAHLTVSGLAWEDPKTKAWLGEIKKWPEIAETHRVLSGEVILQTRDPKNTTAVAAKLRGVDSLSENFLKKISLYPPDPGGWTLLGGNELLAAVGIHPDWEEKIRLTFPFGEIGPTGDWVPHQIETVVSHSFRTGLYGWDAYTCLVPLETAQYLLGERAETGLQIWLKDFSQLGRLEAKLLQEAPPAAQVASFAKQNERLSAALKLERVGMMLLLILFLLIASFSLAGLLTMFLSAKQRDLAILMAVGLSKKGAGRLYQTLGLLLGGMGTLLGVLLGIVVCVYLKYHPISLPPTYYLDYLPVKGGVSIYLTVLGLGLLLSAVAAGYPSWVARRLEILPLLREE